MALLSYAGPVNLSRRRGVATALASCLVFAACSSDGESGPEVTTFATTTTTTPPTASSDGRLVIGALLPLSDSVIGEPMAAAVETAVDRMNAAGGVLGRPVRLIVVDEGGSTAIASTSIQSLIDADVDAVIGPTSSITALSTLDQLVSAGIAVCSPTASTLALDDFPDNGLFFRTVPSDSLQALAIAEAVDQTGAQRVTISHVDDLYGRGFADAVEGWLDTEAVTVTERVPFASDDDDLTDEARTIAESDAQAAIVLADGNDATRLLEALDDEDTSRFATVVVNDALRNPAAPQRIEGLSPQLRNLIVGLAPQAESGDPDAPFDPPGLFAANTYDCANLIALAAARADSDAAADIASGLAQTSVSGSLCSSFAECQDTLGAGLQIDYNGPSGVTDLNTRSGDPARAVFDRFVFDSAGRDILQRSIIVGG